MKPFPISVATLVVSLLLAPALLAQSPDSANQNAAAPSASTTEVPRLIKFSGTLLDAQDHPMAGPVGVTFALYSQQNGGAALWLETQNVKPDANGLYTVLLGANSANGVPAELFASGEARWLEVQVERQAEQPRVLLVSVPYALKAKDAETLGGKPASAFVTTETLAGTGSSAGGTVTAPSSSTASTTLPSSKTQTTTKKAASAAQPAVACTSVTSDGTATANSVAKFTTACNIQNSAITETGGNVGIGTAAPAVALDVLGNNAGLRLSGTGTHQVMVTGATSGRLGQDANGFFFASDTNGKTVRFLTNNGTLNEWMRITSTGNVGIGTPTPGARLEVAGNVMVSNGGVIAGSGAGLTNVNAALLNGLASTAFATMGANSFTGNQSITGDVNLTGSLGLPHTTGATGVITMAGIPFMHNFGVNNTFLGGGAGNFTMTGQSNTAIGANSLLINRTGVANTAVGAGALDNSTDGGNNTASGTLALRANTTGNNNTAVGFNAGVTPTTANANTAGSNNTFLGFQSGPGTSTQLSNATAIGANALVNCNNCMVLGDSTVNVGIGTSNPGQKLSVVGMIESTTGGFKFPDGTVQTTAASGGGTVTSVTAGAGLSASPTNPITSSGTFSIATAGVTNSMLASSSVTVNAGTGLTGGGAVTLGNSLTLNNTGVLSFNGRPGLVTPTAGDYSFSQISGATTSAQLPAASLVRAITYLAGCDSCSLLTTADSQNTIFLNLIGSMTINSVTCFSDAGAPTVNIQRNQAGTLTNILSANLTCSTAGATSSSFSTSVISLNDSLNFIMATADGVAKRVTVIIKATVN
jgi:trimeric autotransporter adhesin